MPATSSITNRAQQLIDELHSYDSALIAFSAGVDSALVAKAAALALGDRAIAVTGHSPSLAAGELDEARCVAREIGIRHQIIRTHEFARRAYTQNATDRCFHCKTELYAHLAPLARQHGIHVIANGTNADDLSDHRPGLVAADKFDVRSPLAELGFHKSDVRQLAAFWELSVHNKPATPCLSSRVAYGQEVTPERLRMIDEAERFLRELLDVAQLRVRYHADNAARVELPTTHIATACEPDNYQRIDRRLRQLGFQTVTIDPAGYRSGSLNTMVPMEALLGTARSATDKTIRDSTDQR